MNKIYKLTLDINNSDIPFQIERSCGSQGGDLIEVLSKFPFELAKMLREIHEEEIQKLKEKSYENDVPF